MLLPLCLGGPMPGGALPHAWGGPRVQAQRWPGDQTPREGVGTAWAEELVPHRSPGWKLGVLVKEAGLILVDPTLESLGLSGRGGPSDILL